MNPARKPLLACALALGLALGAAPALAQKKPADVDQKRLLAATKEPGNWMTRGGTYYEWHYSPLDKINVSNVGRLKLAWYGDFDTNRGQQATPLMVDGVLYTSTAWSKVYAYNAATGKQLWQYDPKVPGKTAIDACCDVVNRGVAAWNGKIYVATLDGRLVALDAKSGQEVWSTITVDQTKPYTITGAPRIAKGKVVIGNSGSEYGVRGYVSAYDAETGKMAWRFYLTPNPTNASDGAASDEILQEIAYKTWGDGAWKLTGGGGTAWDAIVYDPDFDQFIIGTGNANPWSWKSRSNNFGDNLFVGSVVAVDAESGLYKWHYQETPGDDWDYTSVQPISLADLRIDGRMRKVALHAPKNGFFYVIDRKDGKLVSAEKFATVNWAAGIDMKTGRPIEYPEARYGVNGGDFFAIPGPFGAHNWHPMSYSPKTGLVYVPVQNIPFGYKDDGTFQYVPGHGSWNLANNSGQYAGPKNEAERRVKQLQTEGYLLAWDPVTQTEKWRFQHPSPGFGGVLSTAGNLVFQGTPDGRLVAYTADRGQKVWSWQGTDGIVAGAMSYEVRGEQYIAVLAGFGGSNGLHVPYITNPRTDAHGRVLVFKIDGKAATPATKRPLLEANVPNETWPDEVVKKGAAVYGNCLLCHGFGAYSNGVVPDLRRSPMLSNKAAWDAVVLGGAKESLGMPNWSGKLSPEDVEAVRAYIADRAKQLKADEDAAKKVSSR
jgi:PQQ-dependent dehydrogenase (methanol/ethanol family)